MPFSKNLLLFSLALPLSAAAEVRVGDRAADFQQRTIDSGHGGGGGAQTFQLSSLRGKVVLLDFWASWCEPCKKELPLLAKLAERLPPDIQIVAVNIDQNPKNAEAFLRSLGLKKLTVVVDRDMSIVGKWEPAKMPSSFVVDKSGVVRAVNSGFDEGDEVKIEKQLLTVAKK